VVLSAAKLSAAFALGFVIGALRLPWEIACEFLMKPTQISLSYSWN
jgi:hypothetical protein